MDNFNNSQTVDEQYATTKSLDTRISIHDKYSTNKQGFGSWVVSHYHFQKDYKVLELGAGNGHLWKGNESIYLLPSLLVISDLSEKRLESSKKSLGNHPNIQYQLIDIQDIPYEDKSFDIIIANMMLYHVNDLNKALSEVRRTLKDGGLFYAATYGENGINGYLSGLFAEYGIKTSFNNSFTMQNGKDKLAPFFHIIERYDYEDSLLVTSIDDMVDYIFSLASMSEFGKLSRVLVKEVLQKQMVAGTLSIPKEYGLYVAK